MKHMKKIVALVLVVVSLFSLATSALADVISCSNCGATAVRTYGEEYVVDDEYMNTADAQYIRFLMRRPYTVRCTANQYHVYDGYSQYYTPWQLVGYWE